MSNTVSITLSKSFDDDSRNHLMIPALLDILIKLANEKSDSYYKQIIEDCKDWIVDEFETV